MPRRNWWTCSYCGASTDFKGSDYPHGWLKLDIFQNGPPLPSSQRSIRTHCPDCGGVMFDEFKVLTTRFRLYKITHDLTYFYDGILRRAP